jgi:tRNA modification GTPase
MSADRICALATPSGRSAIAIIRVSGPNLENLIHALFDKGLKSRVASLRVARNSEKKPIDEVVATFFKGPASYTGEDVLEISCHGNPLIVEDLLREIVSHETRPAEPGEFTRRALANGRLSLHQVESLDWVLNSTQSEGVAFGLQSKWAGISDHFQALIDSMTNLMVDFQAQLDFSEDEVGALSRDEVLTQMDQVIHQLQSLLSSYQSRQKWLSQQTIVLLGPPNAGKSSLFNALLGDERALVDSEAGTTRDFIEASLVLKGRELRLFDTAGLRNGVAGVEARGIERSKRLLAAADLVIWVHDHAEDPSSEDLGTLRPGVSVLKVCSKSDLSRQSATSGWISVSAVDKSGLDELKAALLNGLELDKGEGELENLGLVSSRQADGARKALELLNQGREIINSGGFWDQASQKVLGAENALRGVLGEIAHSDVLKSIFSRFCIGK